MQFTIGVGGAPGRQGEAAAALEAAGYDGVCAGDHRASPHGPHVWTTLAAIAMATERVTITSSVANNLFRHPTEFVQASVSLSALSNGRFEAGIGAGWTRSELEAMGHELPPPGERLDRLVEACTIARPLLRGDACHFRGVHYTAHYDAVPDANVAPPLVAAVGGPISCRRVAPLVDRVEVMFGSAVSGGSLDFAVWQELTIDHLRRRIDIVRETAPSVKIGVGVFAAAGSDDGVSRLVDMAGSNLQSKLVGEPGAVAEALQSLAQLGIDRIAIAPMTPSTGENLAPALFADR